jgi:hypothetical protein
MKEIVKIISDTIVEQIEKYYTGDRAEYEEYYQKYLLTNTELPVFIDGDEGTIIIPEEDHYLITVGRRLTYGSMLFKKFDKDDKLNHECDEYFDHIDEEKTLCYDYHSGKIDTIDKLVYS